MKKGRCRVHAEGVEGHLWFGGLVQVRDLSQTIMSVTSHFPGPESEILVVKASSAMGLLEMQKSQGGGFIWPAEGSVQTDPPPKRGLEEGEEYNLELQASSLSPWTQITPFPSEGPALGTSLRSHCSGSSSQPDLHFATWQPDHSQPSPERTGSWSPCESPAPGSQLGCPGHIPWTRLWFPTAAPSQGLRLLHSTPDEPSMRKKREGTGPGLCLQTSNTSSRWGLVLVKGPLQLQRRASAVRFMVHIIRAARLPPTRPGDGLRRQTQAAAPPWEMGLPCLCTWIGAWM